MSKNQILSNLRGGHQPSPNGTHAPESGDPPPGKGDAWEPGQEDEFDYSDPWPELPEAALHGLAGEIVRALDPVTESDPAAILAQSLALAGGYLGRTAHVVVEDWPHYLNEFMALVGISGKGRKGTSLRRVKSLFEPLDPEWFSNRILGGLSSGEGVIEAVKDDPSAPDRDKRLMVVEEEFGGVLKVGNRDSNILTTILRQAWDGVDLRTLTKNSPLVAKAAHVSIIGHITIRELQALLSVTDTMNGLGNRFLWCCVRRTKKLPFGGQLEARLRFEIQAKLTNRLRAAREFGELKRSPAFNRKWGDTYDTLSADKPGLWGSLTARSEAHTLRLSALYAVLDGSETIEECHLTAALAFWSYCDASVRYIWSDATGDKLADRLLEELRSSSSPQSRTQLRAATSGNYSASQIGKALDLLAQFRLAEGVKEPSRGGRPPEYWKAVRGTRKTP